MNGGVSCRIGRSFEGTRDDRVTVEKIDQAVEFGAERIQQPGGRGLIGDQGSQHLCGRLRRIELPGDAREFGLIAAQVRHADVEQSLQRQVHHLFVLQLAPEDVGPETEVPLRARQQFLTLPGTEILEGGEHRGIAAGELALQRRILHAVKGQRQVVAEEADDSGKLLQRDLGEDARRILQVVPRDRQRRRHRALARDDQAQALGSRREAALHERIGAVGDGRGVVARILFPGPDRAQREQLTAHVAQQQRAITLRVLRQARRVHRIETPFISLQRADLALHTRARQILQPIVVLVDAFMRGVGGVHGEVIGVEVLVGERRQRGVAGTGRPRGPSGSRGEQQADQ